MITLYGVFAINTEVVYAHRCYHCERIASLCPRHDFREDYVRKPRDG